MRVVRISLAGRKYIISHLRSLPVELLAREEDISIVNNNILLSYYLATKRDGDAGPVRRGRYKYIYVIYYKTNPEMIPVKHTS